MTVDPIARLQALLAALRPSVAVRSFAASTATAAAAATAAGCDIGQIVKSMLFLAEGEPVLVLVAGDRRADTALLAPLLGIARKRIRMASADEVMTTTGYAAGGVPPFGHPAPIETLIDETLSRFEILVAAGGSQHTLFHIERVRLVELARGRVAAISAGLAPAPAPPDDSEH